MSISDHPLFIWPFVVGIVFILIYLSVVYLKWLKKTTYSERRMLLSNVLSAKTWYAVKEAFSECLLHRRIFRFNKRLGYMHMSLAFGWFLLIVVGKLETVLFTHDGFNPPYLPIFFKYFYPNGIPDNFEGVLFLTLMDLLLIFVLSGLLMAVIKRFRSKAMGMMRTTRHIPADRIALTFLWFIFPLRWLAESITAGICNAGGFFTLGSGKLLATFLPLDALFVPAWWAYSIVLGGFFIALPFSRYMHIFTEAAMIFLKHWGLKATNRDNGFDSFAVNACSRCGICTNVCQLSADADIHYSQAVYFLRDTRYKMLQRETAEDCFLCGRCTQACPVEIDVDRLRLKQRGKQADKLVKPYPWKPVETQQEQDVEVLYFAGCMSHLTPTIMQATKNILSKAGIRFTVLDEQGGICCGRPAMQAGFFKQAKAMIDSTTEMINRSGASVLLVSCPICYKVFNENYNLDIPVEHHSVYFRNLLLERPQLVSKLPFRASYHDPCDLGRGSGIYEQPREIIQKIGTLVPAAQTGRDSLCCGGSLANLAISPEQRNKITHTAFAMLAANSPDYIVTACPLCKKTFSAGKREIPVIDIAEIIDMAMNASSTHRRFNVINAERALIKKI